MIPDGTKQIIKDDWKTSQNNEFRLLIQTSCLTEHMKLLASNTYETINIQPNDLIR